jgi:hypothetical protein
MFFTFVFSWCSFSRCCMDAVQDSGEGGQESEGRKNGWMKGSAGK